MAKAKSHFWELLCAVVFPPMGVFMSEGCGGALCINIIMTLLGYIPGIIHAITTINRHDREEEAHQMPMQPQYQGPPHQQQMPPHHQHQAPPNYA